MKGSETCHCPLNCQILIFFAVKFQKVKSQLVLQDQRFISLHKTIHLRKYPTRPKLNIPQHVPPIRGQLGCLQQARHRELHAECELQIRSLCYQAQSASY